MADVSIDSIQLQIESDSSDAEKSVERLATSLLGLNKTLVKVGNNAGAVRSLARSLAALNDIKIPNLDGLVSKLKELSEINPDKLTKKVSVKVNTDGIDKLDGLKERLERAFSGLKELKLSQTGVTGLLRSITQIANTDLTKFDSNSFNGIIDGLKRFSSLKDADLKGVGVTNVANAISRLSKTDMQKVASDLEGIKNAFSGFSGLDMKATGVSNIASSIIRLTKVDLSKLNLSAFTPFIESLQAMTQLQGVTESAKGIGTFVNALNRLLKVTEDMDGVDQRLTALSATLGTFYESLANMPEISENTVRMTEALSNLGKVSVQSTKGLSNYGSQSEAVTVITKAVDTAINDATAIFKKFFAVLQKLGKAVYIQPLKNLANVAKELGTKGADGIKNFIGKIKELNNAGTSFKSFGEKLKEILGLLVGIRGVTGVFNWVKDATEAGANVAETNHIIEQTFGDLSDQVNNWAKDAIENYGIAQTSAKRYAGTLSAMFQSSGIGYKDAAQMSMDLVGMAGDLSSFYNVDTATVFQKLKSGMAGMVRPLRDFGIDLSVASLNEYALAQGMGKTYAQMTQAEKTMLRYQYLLNATTNQANDFKNTNMSMANSLRTFKAYVEAITETLGEGFVSALRHVVHWLNTIAKRVLSVAQVFRDFMEVLFGKNISGGGITVNDYEDIDDFASDTANATGATSDNLGDAADNAKELKKELSVLPFDELNQLAKPKEESEAKSPSGSSGGIGDSSLGDVGTGLLDQMSEAFKGNGLPDAINEWAERIKKAFLDKDWKGLGEALADGINEGIQKLYDLLDPNKLHKKIDPWVDGFIETFNSLVDNIHFGQLGSAMARGLNFLLEEANRILTKIDWENLGKKLAEWANGLVHDVEWDQLGQFFANKLNVFWEIASGFVDDFNWTELGLGLSEGADNFVKQVDYDAMINTVTGGLKGISDTVRTFAQNFPWAENGQLIADKVNDFIDKLPTAEIGSAMGELIQGIVTGFNKIFDPNEGVNFERLGIRLAIGVYSIIYHVDADEVGTLLGNIFNDAWEFLKGAIEGLPAEDVGTKIGTALRKAINTVSGENIGVTLKMLWNKGWKILKNAVEALGNGKDGTGTGIGEILHDALVKIVDGIDFKDAADTFKGLAKKIAEDIMEFFGDGETWGNLGTKIGEGISSLLTDAELAEKAAGAINAITNALKDLITSAVAALIKHKDEIIANFTSFFAKLDWGSLSLIVGLILAGKLAKAVGALTFAGLKKALIDKIAGIFTKVGVSETVKNAAGGIFTGIKTALGGVATKAATVTLKIKGLFSGLKTSIGNIATTIGESGFFDEFFTGIKTALGGVGVEGSVIALAILATKKIQELNEAIRGGNGQLTEEGGGFDSFLSKLQSVGAIADDTKQKLFLLKESWENGEIDDDSFYKSVVDTLSDAGVSASQAERYIKELSSTMGLTEEQTKFLETAIKGLTDNVDNSKEIFENYGIDASKAVSSIKKSFGDASNSGFALNQNLGNIQQRFAELASDGNIGEALQDVIEEFHLSKEEVDALGKAIDERLGQPGLFNELISGASGAKNELVNLNNSPLDKVGESVSGVKSKMSELFDKTVNAKTSMTELDDSAKSATESSDAYNESSNKTPGIIDLIKTAVTKIGQGLVSRMYDSKEKIDEVVGGWKDNQIDAINKTGEEVKKASSDQAQNIVDGSTETLTNATNLKALHDATFGFKAHLEKGYKDGIESGSPSKLFQRLTEAIPEGIKLALTNSASSIKEAVKKLANDMHYAYKEAATKDRFKQATQPVIDGIKTALQTGKTQTDKAAKELATSLVNTFKTTLSNKKSEMSRTSKQFANEGIVNPIKNAIKDASLRETLSGKLAGLLGAIKEKRWDFEDAGRSLGNALKSGIENIYIKTPWIGVSKYDKSYIDADNWIWVPRYSVGWYRKGGLFSDPSLIGVGEAGDEAVLPLENKKTMSMIADAITKNSNGMGVSQSDITSAVVQAMMANQGNMPSINLYAELKTEDNETLARAVMRGIEQIDYRNNATPKYSY